MSDQKWWTGTQIPSVLTSSPGSTSSVGGADWPIDKVRYYVVDSVNGRDSNLGYIDADPGADISSGVSAVVIKTLARLLAIVPRLGAGRLLAILLKTGTYAEAFQFCGFPGDRQIVIRSTDLFTNTNADKTNCSSAPVLSGPGSGGVFSVNASPAPTVNTFSIASGVLTAEPGIIHSRIRFVSGALAGKVGAIRANTSSQINMLDDLVGAPAAGDTFLIEAPAVTITGVTSFGGNYPGGSAFIGPLDSALSLQGIIVAGISFTSNPLRIASEGDICFSFCKAIGILAISVSSLSLDDNYLDEAQISRNTGAGWVCSVADLHSVQTVRLTGSCTSLLRMRSSCEVAQIYGYYNDVNVVSCGIGPFANVLGFGFCFGPTLFFIVGRGNNRVGTMTIQSSAVKLANSDVFGIGPINIYDGCTVLADGLLGTYSGSFGIGVIGSQNVVLAGLSSVNTVTGSVGDIQVPGSVTIKHTDLLTTNVVDPNGNEIIGTGVKTVSQGVQFINADISQLALGEVVRISAPDSVVRARANTAPNARGPLFVSITRPLAGDRGLFVAANDLQKWVLHDAAPTLRGTSYLDDGTAGAATSTVPPAAATNQKRRMGQVAAVAGNLGLVTGASDLLPVVSDGISD